MRSSAAARPASFSAYVKTLSRLLSGTTRTRNQLPREVRKGSYNDHPTAVFCSRYFDSICSDAPHRSTAHHAAVASLNIEARHGTITAAAYCSATVLRASSADAALGRDAYYAIFGWGARIRTWEWRNQNSSRHFDLTAPFLPTEGKSAHAASKGYSRFPN